MQLKIKATQNKSNSKEMQLKRNATQKKCKLQNAFK
jgi:hypothetical protein